MAENTKIEWTASQNPDGSWSPGYSFNPWIGCTKVSPGCAHCYAETLMDTRWGKVEWGKGNPRVLTSDDNWRQPLKWDRQAKKEGVRRRVFCASLCDVLDAEVSYLWRERMWALIQQCRHLDWLLLTKRPEGFATMLPWSLAQDPTKAWPHVWLGVSVEDQQRAEERIPLLLQTPAALRFLSVEPLLGPVSLERNWLLPKVGGHLRGIGDLHTKFGPVDWVIIGGESGPGARPCAVAWVRALVHQCQAARAACFVKQLGTAAGLHDKKGGTPAEWPEDLRVREFPAPRP